jgi:hypothetical protein
MVARGDPETAVNDAGSNGGTDHASGPDRAKRKKPRCTLVGKDGNVFNVIAIVRRALLDAGEYDLASEFMQRATSAGSHDEVLRLCYEYVDVR